MLELYKKSSKVRQEKMINKLNVKYKKYIIERKVNFKQ